MELRHLRYFIAVAEELHFARAAERLHIEQSPLSRAIKDLEYNLGVQLFERTTRSTRLTWAGQVFLDEARRVLSTLEQAKASAKAAATGYRACPIKNSRPRSAIGCMAVVARSDCQTGRRESVSPMSCYLVSGFYLCNLTAQVTARFAPQILLVA